MPLVAGSYSDVKPAFKEFGRGGDARGGVIVGRRFPDQVSGVGVHGVDTGVHVAEISYVAGADGESAAHARTGVESPIGAACRGVQRIYMTGDAANKYTASRDGWLRVRGIVSRESNAHLSLSLGT